MNGKRRQTFLLSMAVLFSIVYYSWWSAALSEMPWRIGLSISDGTGKTNHKGTLQNDLSDNIRDLINALRSESEGKGLRDWCSHKTGYCFPGLDEDLLSTAFRGRSIALVGDSTLYYPMKWLFRLLLKTDNNTSHMWQQNTSTSFTYINPTGDPHLGLPGPPPVLKQKSDGTHIAWYGFAGPAANTCNFSSVWDRVRQHSPEILVVNFGLHWLHLTPSRSVRSCVVERWLEYETFLDNVTRLAVEINAKILLFKTTNLICDDQYYGGLSAANQLYRSKDKDTLQKCHESVNKSFSHSGVVLTDTGSVDSYCQNGTFNEIGSAHLNRRMEKHVREWQAPEGSNLTMRLLNEHDLQSCSYTNDGRHYHTLNLVRIRLLGNIINCLNEKPLDYQ